MRILIAAAGRGRGTPEEELCENYLARAKAMGRKLGFAGAALDAVDVSRAASAKARMMEEAGRLKRKIPPGARRIALDRRGKPATSEEFAQRLAKWRDAGTRDLVFLIGGPDGLAGELRDAADERLAFGPQTWPHLLVRAMLAEQIYRAFSILAGHPYHRGAP